ncbi:MAG: DNA (cytosine-5-)-methyltransferase [bacterium]
MKKLQARLRLMVSLQKTFLEFFAGVGLVRLGLEPSGWRCVFANDLDPKKQETYELNFSTDDPAASSDFLLEDIWKIGSEQLPGAAFLATASFPCVDLSVAGKRNGLKGSESGTFYAFIEILISLKRDGNAPKVVMLENVGGFLTANGGEDVRTALKSLSALGYVQDLFLLDAIHFTPQSRPRVFVIGVEQDLAPSVMVLRSRQKLLGRWQAIIDGNPAIRPRAVTKVMNQNLDVEWGAFRFPAPPMRATALHEVVERLAHDDERWWPEDKVTKLVSQMADRDLERASNLMRGDTLQFATVYKRVRQGRTRAEVRNDGVAGCLRTPRGGSSKQILLQGRRGEMRARWMTPREYGRLQGVPDAYRIPPNVIQGLFAFGDAVCVPAISWIARNALDPCYEHYVAQQKARNAQPDAHQERSG